MLDFNEDLKNTILLLDHKNSPEYSRLYFATNEAINEILSYMDFTGEKGIISTSKWRSCVSSF